MSVGKWNAVESPVCPWERRNLKRAFVSSADPNPANWRIVQSRPRYIVGCTPRVYDTARGIRGPLRNRSSKGIGGVKEVDLLVGNGREPIETLRRFPKAGRQRLVVPFFLRVAIPASFFLSYIVPPNSAASHKYGQRNQRQSIRLRRLGGGLRRNLPLPVGSPFHACAGVHAFRV